MLQVIQTIQNNLKISTAMTLFKIHFRSTIQRSHKLTQYCKTEFIKTSWQLLPKGVNGNVEV